PAEMAELLLGLAHSAGRCQSSYTETEYLARWGAKTIMKLLRADGERVDEGK
ncbi:MAG: hypothetical protein IT337_15265, partial [Thermomicrobiales bacterium]|nr:hypothetical protein [Thermomicrobiales bacterium]